MSLFSRLFSPRRNQKKETTPTQSIKNNGPTSFTTFSIEKDQIRVLLFRECDWRGRKLLFDSSSVQKVAFDPQNPAFRARRDSKDLIVEISNGFGYQYKRPNQDITALGEAVFGSVAMASRGHTFKVHLLKEPHRVMLTKVFHAPRSEARKRQTSDRSLDDSCSSSINSISDYYNSSSCGSKSGSLERGLHRVTTQEDSGFSRESSNLTTFDWLKHSSGNCDCSSYCPMRYFGLSPQLVCSEPENNCSSLAQKDPSGGSLSSLRRRWNRSMDTSMNLSKYITPSSQTESGSSSELNPSQISAGKRTKLGIALLIPTQENQQMEMETFLLEHLSLLINILTRLQFSTEQAYLHKDIFVQSMMDASQKASLSVYDLINALRVETPMWLSLTSISSDPTSVTELSTKFMQDFSHLLQTVDTKHTNFFVSTLLTAVLTHHLGWIQTVISDLDSSIKPDHLLAVLSRNHPYNPFWAQQSDLRGALTFPLKIARTIVVGQSETLVNKLLFMLSYFIRCGQVAIKEQNLDILDCEEKITDLIESRQKEYNDETDFYNKIREFNQTKSFGGSTSGSTSTLCKSKTILSLKTFSINSEDMGNKTENNKLCNEFCHFEDSLSDTVHNEHHTLGIDEKVNGLRKTKSFAKLKDSSCLNKSFSEEMYEKNIKFGALKRSHNSLSNSKSSLLYSDFDGKIRLINESNKNTTSLKIDLEKQLSSVDIKNVLNLSKSELSNDEDKTHSFLKQNLLQTSVSLEKEEKVVFVLGENDKLIDIKKNDEINYENQGWNDSDNKSVQGKENPVILINDFQIENTSYDKNINHLEERNKTEFVRGDVVSRVVIVKSTPIDIEGNARNLLVNQEPFPRCLSVPEIVFSNESFRLQRSKNAFELIRRWFSDSEIVSRESRYLDNLPSNICDKTNNSTIIESKKPFKTISGVLNEFGTKNIMCCSNFLNNDDQSCYCEQETGSKSSKVDKLDDVMGAVELPLMRNVENGKEEETNLAKSMLGGLNNHYIPELVLQGISQVTPGWEAVLKRDLMLEAHASELESDITESVCIIANTDTWEVFLVSSHTVVVDKTVGGVGIRVGMSHLIANIMETTHHLCQLAVPPQVCLNHIESKLSELCIRSHALAEMLLASEFLDMAKLTSALDLDPNDVPLLLSVASTHTPQVTREYGLSFQ